MISSSIRVLQVNLNRSPQATESALQTAVELKVDLIIIQEPWIIFNKDQLDFRNTKSILHSAYMQILPADLTLRPRTLVYVARTFQPTVNLAKESPLDPDLLVIDIIEGNQKIQLLNVYNELDQGESNTRTLERVLYDYILVPSSILLGDFNIHHLWWDSLARTTPNADKLVDWFETNQLSLLNTPGTGTFFRPNLTKESVLDLTLVTSSLISRITDWQTIPDLGSDHYGILFTVLGTGLKSVENPVVQSTKYNTCLTD